ncbi:MAG: hypothetical protein A4E26_00054 [Methanobacterium sp. PtaU1.Bin097]|jgi:hypothetical protein|nr:MAG: hypothetical protein A4E26_00054 [Methanobacterium sp. PtaU1.Bin097]
MDQHDCIQEKRLDRIESDLEKEAKKHEDLRKTINGKLDQIYKAIQTGDDKNLKYIFLVVGMFLGALISVIGFFIAYIK